MKLKLRLLMSCLFIVPVLQQLSIVSETEAASGKNYDTAKNAMGTYNNKFDTNSVLELCKEKNVDFSDRQNVPRGKQTLGYRFNRDKFADIISEVNGSSPNLSNHDKNIMSILIQDVLIGNRQGSGGIDFRPGVKDMSEAIKFYNENGNSEKPSEDVKRGVEYINGFVVREMLINISEFRYVGDYQKNYFDALKKVAKFLDENNKGKTNFSGNWGVIRSFCDNVVSSVFGQDCEESKVQVPCPLAYSGFLYQRKEKVVRCLSSVKTLNRAKNNAVGQFLESLQNNIGLFNNLVDGTKELAIKGKKLLESAPRVQEELDKIVSRSSSDSVVYTTGAGNENNVSDAREFEDVLYFYPVWAGSDEKKVEKYEDLYEWLKGKYSEQEYQFEFDKRPALYKLSHVYNEIKDLWSQRMVWENVMLFDVLLRIENLTEDEMDSESINFSKLNSNMADVMTRNEVVLGNLFSPQDRLKWLNLFNALYAEDCHKEVLDTYNRTGVKIGDYSYGGGQYMWSLRGEYEGVLRAIDDLPYLNDPKVRANVSEQINTVNDLDSIIANLRMFAEFLDKYERYRDFDLSFIERARSGLTTLVSKAASTFGLDNYFKYVCDVDVRPGQKYEVGAHLGRRLVHKAEYKCDDCETYDVLITSENVADDDEKDANKHYEKKQILWFGPKLSKDQNRNQYTIFDHGLTGFSEYYISNCSEPQRSVYGPCLNLVGKKDIPITIRKYDDQGKYFDDEYICTVANHRNIVDCYKKNNKSSQ